MNGASHQILSVGRPVMLTRVDPGGSGVSDVVSTLFPWADNLRRHSNEV